MLRFDETIAKRYADKVISRPLAVDLEPSLMHIAERQARFSHKGWLESKAAKGYIYGPKTNDDPKKGPLTNPLMVPYDQLPEDVKESNIANAVAVIKILKEKKVTFVNFTQIILYPMAKQIHDEWCRKKIKEGWRWGPVTDIDNKIHRDLIPFGILLANPDLRGDVAFDISTAKEIIIQLISEADVFPVISDLSQFTIDEVESFA